MIAKTSAYKTSDDKTFENLQCAQEHELELLLRNAGPIVHEDLPTICARIVAESARVLDILSTRANSRPKARTVNGATRKKRTPRTDTAATLALK